jgi:hypothetical protein
MALGAGLALNNGLAVLEALWGIPSGFRRTPKLRIGGDADSGARQALLRRGRYRGDPTRLALLEGFLALLFLFGALRFAEEGLSASIPFLLLFAAGNGWVAALSFAQSLSLRLQPRSLAGAAAP